MEYSKATDTEDGMVVKRLSVPPGLEELMESLTKEVLMWQPKDVCTFASDYFARLLLLRDQGHYKEKKAKKTIALSRPMARDILRDIKVSESAAAYRRPKRMISKQLSMDVGNDQIPPSAKTPVITKMKKSVSVQNPNENLSKAERRRIIRRKTPNNEVLVKREQASRETSSVRKQSIPSTPASGSSVKSGATKKTPRVATTSPRKKDPKEKENKDNEVQKKPPSAPEKKPLKKVPSQASLITPRSKKGLLSKDNIPKSLPIPIPVPIPLKTRSRKGKTQDDAKPEETPAETSKDPETEQNASAEEIVVEKEVVENVETLNKGAVEVDDTVVVEAANLEVKDNDDQVISDMKSGHLEENLKDIIEAVESEIEVSKEFENAATTIETAEEEINKQTDNNEIIYDSNKLHEELSKDTSKEEENESGDIKIEEYDLKDIVEAVENEIEITKELENAATTVETAEEEIDKQTDNNEIVYDSNKLLEELSKDTSKEEENETGDIKIEEPEINIDYNHSKLHEELISIDKVVEDVEAAKEEVVNQAKDDAAEVLANITYDANSLHEEVVKGIEDVEEEVIDTVRLEADFEQITDSKVSYGAEKLHEELNKDLKDSEEAESVDVLKDSCESESQSNISYDPNKLHEELSNQTVEDGAIIDSSENDNNNDIVEDNSVKEIDVSSGKSAEEPVAITNINYDPDKLKRELEEIVAEDVKGSNEDQTVEESVILSESTNLNKEGKAHDIVSYDSNKLHDELNTETQPDEDDKEKNIESDSNFVDKDDSRSASKLSYDPEKLKEEIYKSAKEDNDNDKEYDASSALKVEKGSEDKEADDGKSFDSKKLHEELSSSKRGDGKEVDKNLTNELSEEVSKDTNGDKIIAAEAENNVEEIASEDSNKGSAEQRSESSVSYDPNKLHDEIHKDSKKEEETEQENELDKTETEENILEDKKTESSVCYDSDKLHDEIHKDAVEEIKNEESETNSQSQVFGSGIWHDAAQLHDELNSVMENSENEDDKHSQKDTQDEKIVKSASASLNRSLDDSKYDESNENSIRSRSKRSISYDPSSLHDELHKSPQGATDSKDEVDGSKDKDGVVDKTENTALSMSSSYDPNKLHEELHTEVIDNEPEENEKINVEEKSNKDGSAEQIETAVSFDSRKLHEDLSKDSKEDTEHENTEDADQKNELSKETEEHRSESSARYDPKTLHDELHKDLEKDDEEGTAVDANLNTEVTKEGEEIETESSVSYDPEKLHDELRKDLEKDDEDGTAVDANLNTEVTKEGEEIETESSVSYDPEKLRAELYKDVKESPEEAMAEDANLNIEVTKEAKDFKSEGSISYDPPNIHGELSTCTEEENQEVVDDEKDDTKDKISKASAETRSESSTGYDQKKLHDELSKASKTITKEVEILQVLKENVIKSSEKPRSGSTINDTSKKLNEDSNKESNDEVIGSKIIEEVTKEGSLEETEDIRSKSSKDSNEAIVECTVVDDDSNKEQEEQKTESSISYGPKTLNEYMNEDSKDDKEASPEPEESPSESSTSYDPNKLHEELVKDYKDDFEEENVEEKISKELDELDSVPEVYIRSASSVSFDPKKLHDELTKDVTEAEGIAKFSADVNDVKDTEVGDNVKDKNLEERHGSSVSYDPNKLREELFSDDKNENQEKKVEEDEAHSLQSPELTLENNVSYDPNKLHQELHEGSRENENGENLIKSSNENLDESISNSFDNSKLHEELNKEIKENDETNIENDKSVNNTLKKSTTSFDLKKLHDALNTESQPLEETSVEASEDIIEFPVKKSNADANNIKEVAKGVDDALNLNITDNNESKSNIVGEEANEEVNNTIDTNVTLEELNKTSSGVVSDKKADINNDETLISDSADEKVDNSSSYDSSKLHDELNQFSGRDSKEDAVVNEENNCIKGSSEKEKLNDKISFDSNKCDDQLRQTSEDVVDNAEQQKEIVLEDVLKKGIGELRSESTLKSDSPDEKSYKNSSYDSNQLRDELNKISCEDNEKAADKSKDDGLKESEDEELNDKITYDSNKLHEELCKTTEDAVDNTEEEKEVVHEEVVKKVIGELRSESTLSYDSSKLRDEIENVSEKTTGEGEKQEVENENQTAVAKEDQTNLFDPNKLHEEITKTDEEVENKDHAVKSDDQQHSEVNIVYDPNEFHKELTQKVDDEKEDELEQKPQAEEQGIKSNKESEDHSKTIGSEKSFDIKALHDEIHKVNDVEENEKGFENNEVVDMANAEGIKENVEDREQLQQNCEDVETVIGDSKLDTHVQVDNNAQEDTNEDSQNEKDTEEKTIEETNKTENNEEGQVAKGSSDTDREEQSKHLEDILTNDAKISEIEPQENSSEDISKAVNNEQEGLMKENSDSDETKQSKHFEDNTKDDAKISEEETSSNILPVDEVVEENCKVNTAYITGEPNEDNLEAQPTVLKSHNSQEVSNKSPTGETTQKLPTKLMEMNANTWSSDSNDVIVAEKYSPKLSPSGSPLIEATEDQKEAATEISSDAEEGIEKVVQANETLPKSDSTGIDAGTAGVNDLENDNIAKVNKEMLDDGFGDSLVTDDETKTRGKREAAFVVTEEPIFLIQDNEAKINNIGRICNSIEEVEEGGLFKAATTIQAVIRGFLSRRKKKKDEKEQLKKRQQPAECDELLEHRLGVMDTLDQAAIKMQAGVRGFLARKRIANEKEKISSQVKDPVIESPSVVRPVAANVTRGFLIRRNFSDELVSKADRPDEITYKIIAGVDGPKLVEIPRDKQCVSLDTVDNTTGISDSQIIDAMDKLVPPLSSSPVKDLSNKVGGGKTENKSPELEKSRNLKKLHKQEIAVSDDESNGNSAAVAEDRNSKKLRKQETVVSDDGLIEHAINIGGNRNSKKLHKQEIAISEHGLNEKGSDLLENTELTEIQERQIENESLPKINISYDPKKLHEEVKGANKDIEGDDEDTGMEDESNVSGKLGSGNYAVKNEVLVKSEEKCDADKDMQNKELTSEVVAEKRHVSFEGAPSVTSVSNDLVVEDTKKEFEGDNENISNTIVDKANAVVEAVIKTASDVTNSFDNILIANNAVFVNGHYDKGIRLLSSNELSNSVGTTEEITESSVVDKIDCESGNKLTSDGLLACDDSLGKVTEPISHANNADSERGTEILGTAKRESRGELEDNENKMQIKSEDSIAESGDNKLQHAEQKVSSSENRGSKLDLANMSHANLGAIENEYEQEHDMSGVSENKLDKDLEFGNSERNQSKEMGDESVMVAYNKLVPQISITHDDSSNALQEDIDPDAQAICASESAISLSSDDREHLTENVSGESQKIDLAESGNGQKRNTIGDISKNDEVSDFCESSETVEQDNKEVSGTDSADDANKEAATDSLEIDMRLREKSRSSIDSLTSNDSVVTVINNLREPEMTTPDVSVESLEIDDIVEAPDSAKNTSGHSAEKNISTLQKGEDQQETSAKTDINKSQPEKTDILNENLKEIDEVTLTHVIESEWTPENVNSNTVDIDTVIEKEIIRKDTYGARENLAAVAIQSGWRGYQVRHDLKMKQLKKKDESLVFDLELSDGAEDAADSENPSAHRLDEELLTPEAPYATSGDDAHRESTSEPKIEPNENNAKINTPTPQNSIDLVEKVIAKSAKIMAKYAESKSDDEFGNTFSIEDSSSESGAELKVANVFPEDGIPTTPRQQMQNTPLEEAAALDGDIISMATDSSAKSLTENSKPIRFKTPKLKKQTEIIVVPLGQGQDSLTDGDVMDMATTGSAKVFPKKKRSAKKEKEDAIECKPAVKPTLAKQEGLIHSGEGHDLIVPEVLPPVDVPLPEEGATLPEATPEGLQHSGELHDLLPLANQLQAEAPAGAEVLTMPSEATHALPGVPTLHMDDSLHSSMEAGGNRKNSTLKTGDMEEKAATKIQAGFRGYQVRKQMKQSKSNSDSPNSRHLGKRRGSNRRSNEITTKSGSKPTELEEKSATKIQAGIRGFLVRKRQKNTKKTTTQSS